MSDAAPAGWTRLARQLGYSVARNASTSEITTIGTMSLLCGSLGMRLIRYTLLGRKLTCSSRSMNGTITSTLKAISRPSATPPKVPMIPANAPCTMKIDITEPGVAPSVRRIAMSARLSVTVITSVETRLNAATATIRVRMMNIRRFSTCTAANQLRLVRVQSRTVRSGPRLCSSRAATSRAWFGPSGAAARRSVLRRGTASRHRRHGSRPGRCRIHSGRHRRCRRP